MNIVAEVAGSVWKIEKQAGQSVAAGDVVMIIESMKMEIPVEVESAGTVGEILVAEGDAVNEGDTLFTLA